MSRIYKATAEGVSATNNTLVYTLRLITGLSRATICGILITMKTGCGGEVEISSKIPWINNKIHRRR